MDINKLISIIKIKLQKKIVIEHLNIEDKSFLHKNHKGNHPDKFHLKIFIKSEELKSMNKLESNKKINQILKYEINNYIHSIQILIN